MPSSMSPKTGFQLKRHQGKLPPTHVKVEVVHRLFFSLQGSSLETALYITQNLILTIIKTPKPLPILIPSSMSPKTGFQFKKAFKEK